MRSTAGSQSLATALSYVRHGWALLPLAPRSKVPHAALLPIDHDTGKPTWQPLAQHAASESEVRRWIEQDPQANLGVICGPASSGLVVVDFDVPTPTDLHIPETPRVITSRGEHLYFRSTEQIQSHRLYHNGLEIGEVRASGNYVALPPSVHETGHVYEWAEMLSPFDLDWEFAPVPDWAVRLPSQRSVAPRRAQGKQVNNIHYLLTCYGDDFVRAAARLVGIEEKHANASGIGTAFQCVLPGHEDRHPSASLYRNDQGVVVYRDWHAANGDEWYLLPELYASQAYGEPTKLRKPELVTWHLRLLVETGFVEPVSVQLPGPPANLRPAAAKVLDGFLLLLGCKWLYDPGDPTPYTWRFASAWTGVSERHCGNAIKELLRSGVIQIVSQAHSGGRGSMALFLPGESEIS